MSGTRPGRQPVPQRVYWVRRFVVLGLPLLLVVLVVWLVAGRGAGAAADDAAAGPVPTGGASESSASADDQQGGAGGGQGADDEPGSADDDTKDGDAAGATDSTDGATSDEKSAEPPPGGIPDCSADSLSVVLTASAESFAAGVSPTFTLTVRNAGPSPCLVDAGEAHQEIVVTSGTDRVWSSADCPGSDAESRVLLLDAGAEDAQQVAWNRVRSAEGCPGDLPAPGAGTYSATATLDGVSAEPVVFGLG